MKEIDEALNQPKGKYFTVFIDYEKAFDSVNREKLMQKLGDMIGKDHNLIYIIQETMRRNILEITDGVSTSQEIIQTNGVTQGDPISQLLFNVMTADIAHKMKASTLIMYADDMILGSTNKEELQEDINTLHQWETENDLIINRDKTAQMIFRRRGKIKRSDNIMMNGEPLKITNRYKYLGITLQTTVSSFRIHIEEKTAAARNSNETL